MLCNFSGISRSIFASLGIPITLAPGDVLFRPGDSYRGPYILCSGQLRLWPSGKLVLPGEAFGLEFILSRKPYSFGATAVRPARLRLLPADALRAFMRGNIDACLWTMHFI